ncbi:hypothetical protein DZB90_11910 [Bacillus thuringiensis]|nr:hypothetical protein DZB90_11910 [Bacillus thuringiensis]
MPLNIIVILYIYIFSFHLIILIGKVKKKMVQIKVTPEMLEEVALKQQYKMLDKLKVNYEGIDY